MSDKFIGTPENMKLVNRIILNGVVGYCDTHDDNGSTIGIKQIKKISTFNGESIEIKDNGFPLTKEMENILGWGYYYASIRFITGKIPIDPTKVEETIIESIFGNAEAEYNHVYSDYTGYLWTDENFTVGGHNIPSILISHIDEYIHMEIELYNKTK